MGRNQRRTKPLGFQVGECWGDIFAYPENHSASTIAAKYLAQHGGAGGGPMTMRQMVKLREIEDEPERHARAMARIERLQSYGCKIELCIDLFNSADHRDDYHQRIEWPRRKTVAEHTRDLVRQIAPEEVECMNEFWHTKGRDDLRMQKYRDDVVYQMARGCVMSNVRPLPQLNASIVIDRQDSPHDLWVWDVEYDNCAEVYHVFILDQDGQQPQNPRELEAFLNAQPHIVRGNAIGWIWPLKCNETTFNGQHVDLNSELGGQMVATTLQHYFENKYPVTVLAMGGDAPFGGGGEWDLRVNFIDDRGNPSIGVESWLQIVGSDPMPDFGDGPPPIDPPVDPPPGGSGGYEYLEKAEAQLERAKIHWGKQRGINHAERAKGHIETAIGRA